MILTKNEIEGVFVGAIEGGSNYWYLLGDDSVKAIRDKVSKEEIPYLSLAFAEAVQRGAEVPVYDAEDEDELLGTVTKDSLKKGEKKAIDDGRDEVWTMKKGEDDAWTADILFQYFVMGEIVFG